MAYEYIEKTPMGDIRYAIADEGKKILIGDDILVSKIALSPYTDINTVIEVVDGSYIPPILPTPEDSLLTLKNNQILVSKNNLATYLTEHPILSYAHNPNGGYYAVDIDHQNRLASNITSYQIAQMLGQEDCITWNETGKSCEVWKVEEALQLSLEIKTYVRPLISLQQHMEEDIMKCETKEDVLNVNIEFTDDVINNYRVKFNDMIEESLNNK